MKAAILLVLCSILYGVVTSLPCLKNKSKNDFKDTRNALTSLESFLKNQISSTNSKIKSLNEDISSKVATLDEDISSKVATLEKFLNNQVSDVNSKVMALDKDILDMEKDFKMRQRRKYKDHCYYFGTDKLKWTIAERRCREIGGYLVKIDDSSENTWIKQESLKSTQIDHWIGMNDVENGVWRFTYDQTQPSYKNFVSGRPFSTSNSSSYTNNCVTLYSGHGQWYDMPCGNGYPYVCESNFCFS